MLQHTQRCLIILFYLYSGISPAIDSTDVKTSKSVKETGFVESNTATSNSNNWHQDILSTINSPIDLSFLNQNDIPAGKHGFIKRVGEQLAFQDNAPVKFWGANIQAYALFRTSDINIKRHAKRIAQLGFNLIRITHHDTKWVKPNIFKTPTNNTLELSEPALRKLDWWIKCLKDQGIYIWLDLHVGRNLTVNDAINNFDDLAKGKKTVEFKGFNYYNKSILSTMQAFNKAYLSHINQFTHQAYKQDPAVIAMLITNENDLSHHFGNVLLANKGAPQHNKLFNHDAKQFSDKYALTYNETLRTWKMGNSKIYLNDVEHRFNLKMLEHLTQLGVKSLVATTNSWGRMGIVGLPSLSDGTIIDVHSYGQADELSFNPRNKPGFLTWIGAAQISGYPLSVSEWNIEPFPAADRFTAPLFIASIASLQGWDALMLYGYSQHTLGIRTKGHNYSTFNDPAIIGLMPAAALLYRQGHVATAEKTYELKLPREKFFFTRNNPRTSKTIKTILETSRLTIALPDTPELPWLKKHIFSAANAISISNTDKDFIPANQSYVVSDTGELKRDWEAGTHTINTTKSQIASGKIGGKIIQLNAVKFSIKTKTAVVAVQSLENKPIAESKQIFITTMARSKPVNGKNLGFISEPITGEIQINAPANLQLFPITKTGALGKKIAVKFSREKNLYTLTLNSKTKAHWFLLKHI